MNKCNDWENLLAKTNEDLEKKNSKIIVYQDEDGYYFVDIEVDGKREDYSQNNLEEELSDVITSAAHEIYIKTQKKKLYAGTLVLKSDGVPMIFNTFVCNDATSLAILVIGAMINLKPADWPDDFFDQNDVLHECKVGSQTHDYGCDDPLSLGIDTDLHNEFLLTTIIVEL